MRKCDLKRKKGGNLKCSSGPIDLNKSNQKTREDRHFSSVQIVRLSVWNYCIILFCTCTIRFTKIGNMTKWMQFHIGKWSTQKQEKDERVNILCNMKFQWDKIIGHSRPDEAFLGKENRVLLNYWGCLSVPSKTRRRKEKRELQSSKHGITKDWTYCYRRHGTVLENFDHWLKALDFPVSLIGTTRIITKLMDI